jgi:hypothetical protein
MKRQSHAHPSLRSGLSWDWPAAGSNINVKHAGQFTCYEDRTFSLAIDRESWFESSVRHPMQSTLTRVPTPAYA